MSIMDDHTWFPQRRPVSETSSQSTGEIETKTEMSCMKTRLWAVPLLLAIVGCGPAEKPAPPPEMPKDFVRVEPGPVDPDAPEEFTTTDSGLKYRIRRKSDGIKPSIDSIVRVHYRGRANDPEKGTIFDTTYGRTGHSNTFPLNGVVKGWTEGLQLIGEGGMIELEIPPALGYGERAMGNDIPPNSTLHFIVELIEVQSPPPAPKGSEKSSEHNHSHAEHKHSPAETERKSDESKPEEVKSAPTENKAE